MSSIHIINQFNPTTFCTCLTSYVVVFVPVQCTKVRDDVSLCDIGAIVDHQMFKLVFHNIKTSLLMIIFTSFHLTTNSNQIIDKSPWLVYRFYVVSVPTFVIAITIFIATIPFNPYHSLLKTEREIRKHSNIKTRLTILKLKILLIMTYIE